MFKLLELHINDKTRPDKAVLHGKKTLSVLKQHVLDIMSVLAIHGSENIQNAKLAFQEGLKVLSWHEQEMLMAKDWKSQLDTALFEINKLAIYEKENLVIALSSIISANKEVSLEEHELLRAICASLHVPLPVLAE